MIYFDNAATTFPKPECVYRAVDECIRKYCGNPGRASHALSVKCDEKIYQAREAVARLLNIDNPEYVIFVQNATHALNLAIKTTIAPGSHVLISDIEHNAVVRPLYSIHERLGVEYSSFSVTKDIKSQIKSLIRSNTTAVICNLRSNVNGTEIDLSELSEVCRENSLCLIVDASQKIGHKTIDLKKTPCDVLCSPGHKALFGIQGVGFAVICDEKMRESFIEGGSGSDSKNLKMPNYLPDRYEAGTLPTPSIVSLCEGIEFINRIGVENIENHVANLTKKMKETLSSIPEVSFLSGENGVVSFNISTLASYEVSAELDKFGICTRAGFHCAPSAHWLLGTDDFGTVRASFSYFNKMSEIDRFGAVLQKIIKNSKI